VLGQSVNKGWKATIQGSGQVLGSSMLIDGFANGWLVKPTGSATVSVTLRWKPQTSENIALVVSAVSVLACLVLVLVRRPRRRRRASRSRARHGERRPAPPPRLRHRPTLVMREDIDIPALSSPFADAKAVTPGLAAVLAAVCGLGAGVIVPQATFFAVFLGVALGVAVALIVPRARGS